MLHEENTDAENLTEDEKAVTADEDILCQPGNDTPDGSFSKKTVIKYAVILAAITIVTVICIVIAFRVPAYFGF